MQKIKTVEYEFMARLLSPDVLYEFRWKDHVFITKYPKLAQLIRSYLPNLSIKQIKNEPGYYLDFIADAYTVRGAWKKACKKFNQG